jgi:hypothetical protein
MNPKIPDIFKNKAPLSSTFFPKFEINKGATTSPIKSDSSSSNIKSSSSFSSEPLNKKNAKIKEIKFSSTNNAKLI